MLRAIRDLAPELAALFTLPTVNTPLCSGGIIAFILQRVRSKVIMWVAFCFALLSIYNLTSQLQSELCFFYLDTGTLGEVTEQVLSDAEELGLSLNHSKSEVISEDPTARNVLLSRYQKCSLPLCIFASAAGLCVWYYRFSQCTFRKYRSLVARKAAVQCWSQGNDTLPLWIPCLTSKGNEIS